MITGIAIDLATRFAPRLLGGLFGDKAEENAEKVLALGRELTGQEDPEEVQAALEQNQILQAEFRMRGQELAAELEHAYLEDRQDARARDVALRKAGQDNIRADVLAYGILAGWIALIIVALFFPPEGEWEQNALAAALGAISMRVADVFFFEFGSSRGSKKKEELLRPRD